MKVANLDKGFVSQQSPRILVHICCGPCSIIPLKSILMGRAEVWGYFNNPNIHPHSEFRKRLDSVRALARHLSLDMIIEEDYRPMAFVRGMRASLGTKGYPPHVQRCAYCYRVRLEATARTAKERGFSHFTSSLLYSRSQDHAKIRETGLEVAREYGIPFYYEDFRIGWQEGIDESKSMGLYRQKYCGCAYSKFERYANKNCAKTMSSTK